MKINYFKLVGTVYGISEIETYNRPGKPDLRKKTFKINLDDGQILFPEIRGSRLSKCPQIKIGDRVEFEYSFNGSEKQGKIYNNIFINKIKTV